MTQNVWRMDTTLPNGDRISTFETVTDQYQTAMYSFKEEHGRDVLMAIRNNRTKAEALLFHMDIMNRELYSYKHC